MFADEHDGSQSDDDDDGDKITLEELDENFASLGLDFHSRRGDANASPAREVREREGKNAIRDKVKDARISDMVWLPVVDSTSGPVKDGSEVLLMQRGAREWSDRRRKEAKPPGEEEDCTRRAISQERVNIVIR